MLFFCHGFHFRCQDSLFGSVHLCSISRHMKNPFQSRFQLLHEICRTGRRYFAENPVVDENVVILHPFEKKKVHCVQWDRCRVPDAVLPEVPASDMPWHGGRSPLAKIPAPNVTQWRRTGCSLFRGCLWWGHVLRAARYSCRLWQGHRHIVRQRVRP